MGKTMDNVHGLLRRFKLRNRITLFLVLALIFCSGCLITVSRAVAQSLLKSYLYNYIESTQKEISSSTELIIDEINILAARLTVNDAIYDLFNYQKLSYTNRESQLKRILDRLLVHKELVGAIYIVNRRNEVYEYAPSGGFFQKPDLLDINRTKSSILPVWGQTKRDQANNSYIVFGRKYYNFYTGETLGLLFIYIRESALYNVYRKIVPAGSYSFIIADGKRIISHPDKDQVGSVIFDTALFDVKSPFSYKQVHYNGKPVILAISQFNDNLKSIGINWKIISIISEKQLFGAIAGINRIVLIIGSVILMVAILLAVYVSFRITESVAGLKHKLDVFGKSPIQAITSGPPRDEIAVLEESYDKMVQRVQELITKNNLEKEKQRELELIALQAQINPHFIYNTLDAIGWIAKLKNQPEIEKLVVALATFFRISLHKGEKFITVEEEIQLVQSFVTIEQMRFPGKFEISYEIPEELKQHYILKIVLQPLVENAIKHGITPKNGMGHIQIHGMIIGDDLIFEISDDGVGFEMNTANFDISYQKTKYSGYGLRNVNERIVLEYGPDYGIGFESEKHKGTTVRVKLRDTGKRDVEPA